MTTTPEHSFVFSIPNKCSVGKTLLRQLDIQIYFFRPGCRPGDLRHTFDASALRYSFGVMFTTFSNCAAKYSGLLKPTSAAIS